MLLRLRSTVLRCSSRRPLVLGILNASPESFSDGDEVAGLDRQLARAAGLLDAGADMIDVGGESGVTNRAPLASAEEIRRVVPIVEALVNRGTLVSVDTWKPSVALAALEAGAHLINDVSGLRDPTIATHCARFGAGLVILHTRAAPKVKEFPAYADVVSDVAAFLRERLEVATSRGLAPEHLVLDPGPDFAKTPAQSIAVLRNLPVLGSLGRPVLLAVSRKDFVGALTARMPKQRLAGTLAAVGAGLDGGASMLRVHDVAETVDFLRVRAALVGLDEVAPDLRLAEHLRREKHAGTEG
ncbi:MAG: dihydropteroate synthase [Actinobacteria bacterium]|nr:dihydropteroate synthase [Actinomycetota bacterium]